MATTPTSTDSQTPPAAPIDPGVIATTLPLGFVPLTGDAAEAAVRAAARNAPQAVNWGNLVTLKILLPAESSQVIISPYGDEILIRLVEALMQDVRGRL